MAEYIEKSAAVCIADYAADEHPYSKERDKPETWSRYNQGWNDACDYIRDKLEEAPAADVAPVRHGRWEFKWDAERDPKRLFVRIVCSNCGLKTGSESNYCPCCGARCDKDGEENALD